MARTKLRVEALSDSKRPEILPSKRFTMDTLTLVISCSGGDAIEDLNPLTSYAPEVLTDLEQMGNAYASIALG
ncbi:hypothetical protein E2542_SST00598 [Spatholobus suberectus]|nr:hypothetical protein E2542_SST00598 [Spatholobus suberectus]